MLRIRLGLTATTAMAGAIPPRASTVGDKVLGRALASRMIRALRQQWRRGLLTGAGKVKGVRIWALSPQGTA
jgi:hypothetical protein